MKYTFLTMLLMLFTSTASAQLISEFQPNPGGTDPAMQTVELSGTPNMSFTDWTFLTIEAEGSTTGIIDRATTFSGTFDANGLFTVDVADLENPAFTAVLASGFMGAEGDDIDTDDDGMIDAGLFTVIDSIGVQDSGSDGSGDTFFTPNLIAVPMGSNEPPLVFRDPSGAIFAAFIVDAMGMVGIFDINGQPQDLADFGLDATSMITDLESFGMPNPGLPVMGGMLGDVDMNGMVDFFDIQPFIDLLSNGEFQFEADIDGDGEVTFFDIQPFIDILSGGSA